MNSSNNPKTNIAKIITGTMFFTLLGKLFGFIKELILAYYFGADKISDAYLISQTIPGTLFQVIGTGIATCFIPIYIRTRSSEGRESASTFTNNFITLILIVVLSMTLILELFPGFFVKIFAMGFDDSTFLLAKKFTRINSSGLILSGFLYCYSALLQAENKYHHVAFANIIYNVGLIISIILGALINVYLLSIMSVVAVLLQLLYVKHNVQRISYKYHCLFNIRDKKLVNSLSLLPPVILGIAASEINILVDRTLSSLIILGGITIITYGTSLFNLIIGVFSNSIASIYYPIISEARANNDKELLEKTVQDSVYLSLFFLIPCTIVAFLMSNQIVKLFFGHGEFGNEHIDLLSKVFACYTIGFIPFSIKQILNNLYYSYEKTKKPMINTLIGVTANVILNILLSKFIGLQGLAISTSLSAILIAILLIIGAKKDFEIRILSKYKKLLFVLISSAVLGIFCYLIDYFFSANLYFTVFTIILMIILYLLISILLNTCPFNIHKIIKRKRDEKSL